MCHHACLALTPDLFASDSANATLAIGASPIMATVPSEVTQLSKIIGALLINFGTIKDVDGFLAAGAFGVLDPRHTSRLMLTTSSCSQELPPTRTASPSSLILLPLVPPTFGARRPPVRVTRTERALCVDD